MNKSKIIFNNHKGIREEELRKFLAKNHGKNKGERLFVQKFNSISEFFSCLNSDKIIFIEEDLRTSLKELRSVKKIKNEDKRIIALAMRAGRLNISFLGLKDFESSRDDLLRIINSL
ncbi:MAG: hypothetical protein ACP5OZ_02810 [Candidatus Woesearchaeota archaeon]